MSGAGATTQVDSTQSTKCSVVDKLTRSRDQSSCIYYNQCGNYDLLFSVDRLFVKWEELVKTLVLRADLPQVT